MMQWHFRTLTRGAREAVTIKTWPALAGEGSLRIVAHSFLMASAWPTLVYVFRQEREKSAVQAIVFSARLTCRGLLWQGSTL